MGTCSSRSDRDAVVLTATATSEGYTYSLPSRHRRRSSRNVPASIARRGSSPSPLVAYLSELDSSDLESSLDMRSRRPSRLRMRRASSGMRRGSRTPEEERQRISEIEQLQQSLAAMEDFFQSLLGQAQIYMEAMDPSGGAGSGPPPASNTAIRSLPLVALTSRDMENENNRTCGICCENHTMGDKVSQMPCGHVYHGECLEPWLSRHCTCPVCRYELPTDDAGYEPGRRERMAVRKVHSDTSTEQEEDEESRWEVVSNEVQQGSAEA